MQGRLNLAQIVLICALGLEARIQDFRWRDGHPRLCEWFDRLAARPSIAANGFARGPLSAGGLCSGQQ
jgi:glutathione S-transferase